MMILLLLISLIGYFLFIAKLFRWSVAATPLFVICMIPSFLYIFGIFNMLALGAHFLFYIGLAFFAGYLLLCFKEKQLPYAEIFHPGLILFVFYFVFLYFACRQLSLCGWDEFVHWGLVTKDIVLNNKLTDSNSAVAYKGVVPGMTLFHYFVVSIIGYSEGMVYFAQNIFLVASFTALFQKNKWTQFYSLVLIFLITYNLIFFYGGFSFHSLDNDRIVGAVFGISLASYFLFKGSNIGRIGHLIPVLFFLPLIKQIGFFFAICVMVIIISDYLFRLFRGAWLFKKDQFVRVNSKPTFSSKYKLAGKKNILLTLILLAAIMLTPFISNISWKGWLNKNHIQEPFSGANISIGQIKKSFSKENATSRDKETLKNFQEGFFKEPVLSGAKDSYLGKHIKNKQLMSAAACLVICLILALFSILLQLTPGERHRVLICQAIILFFFVIYCFVLLLVYLYYFSSYEGPRIASFGRYISIYFLGWSFISIGLFVAIPRGSLVQYRLSRLFLAIILAFLILLTPASNKRFLFGKDLPMATRTEVEQYLPIVQKNCSLNSRIYFIWQNDTGVRSWIFGYGICPRKTNSGGIGGAWSLGEPYYEGDVWTVNYTLEQLLNVFREYDYILIAKADERFWKKYGALFNDVDLTKYILDVNTQKAKAYEGNLMMDGTIKTIEQGPAAWAGGNIARVNDGVTDAAAGNAYGYTGNGAEVSNNGRGLTLTFNRSVALTSLVHWAYSNMTFNYVIEYYTGGTWAAVATIACPTGIPPVISFNADQSKSSTQWRWHISDWSNPGNNFYAFELGAYESIKAFSEYNNYLNCGSGSLFKIIKSPNGNISIRKIE